MLHTLIYLCASVAVCVGVRVCVFGVPTARVCVRVCLLVYANGKFGAAYSKTASQTHLLRTHVGRVFVR